MAYSPLLLTTNKRSNWVSQVQTKLLVNWGGDSILSTTIINDWVEVAERNLRRKVTAGNLVMATIIANGAAVGATDAQKDDLEYLIDAAIAQIAGMLAQPIRSLQAKDEKASDLDKQYDIDYDKLEADLMGEVMMNLTNITGYVPTAITRAMTIDQDATFEQMDEDSIFVPLVL